MNRELQRINEKKDVMGILKHSIIKKNEKCCFW